MQGSWGRMAPVLPVTALPQSHVRLDVEIASMDELFATVAQVIAGPERPRPEQVVQRLRRRHLRSSPALGDGLALPHAAVPRIRRPFAVYLRLRAPVRFHDSDEQGVSDCLALLVPTPGFQSDHELL